MILATDVQYFNDKGVAAGVLFSNWGACEAVAEFVSEVENVEKYIPGKFYQRELPCLLKLINDHKLMPEIIIVDGYVFLDGVSKPGLGKYLFDALNGDVDIVGIAKSAFADIGEDYKVLRGISRNPLYVTTIGKGLELGMVKKQVASMCGDNRIPLLLKRVDQLCRG